MSYLTGTSTQTLGDHLKAWRLRAGLKQEEVAKRLCIDQTAVSAMERGTQRVPHDRLAALVSLYKVPAVDVGIALGADAPASGGAA